MQFLTDLAARIAAATPADPDTFAAIAPDDITNIFWAAVRTEVGYPDKGMVGIRKGAVPMPFPYSNRKERPPQLLHIGGRRPPF